MASSPVAASGGSGSSRPGSTHVLSSHAPAPAASSSSDATAPQPGQAATFNVLSSAAALPSSLYGAKLLQPAGRTSASSAPSAGGAGGGGGGAAAPSSFMRFSSGNGGGSG